MVHFFGRCRAIFVDFYTTLPPEMGQNLVTWGSMTNENIEKYSTKNISNKTQNIKKSLESILGQNFKEMEFFGQKWPNFGSFWTKRGQFSTKKRNGHFFTFIKPRPREKNQKNLMRQFENMSKKH